MFAHMGAGIPPIWRRSPVASPASIAATRNRDDFEILRELVGELYPGVTPLAIVDPLDHGPDRR
jgi:hypothetical protein